MPLRRFVLLLAAWWCVGTAAAQDHPDTKTPTTKAELPAVEVRFADDSVVKVALQATTIDVTTRYGKLSIPVAEVRRIEFGLHIPDDVAKKIAAAVAQLGSAEFRQRETATNELLELRELAYPALQKAATSEIPEVARRAKAAIKTLGETVAADKLHLAQTDTIVAADFTVVGRVDAEALKVRTPYFGDSTLKLVDLRSVRWLSNGRESKVTVDATRYGGAQETWMDTGIEIRSGASLQVQATGTVDLRTAAGDTGINLSGPDGLVSRGRGGNGFGAAGGPGGPGAGGGRNAMARPASGTMAPGMLIGRIGEYGKVFVVGARFESPATEDGKLFLRIVPSATSGESSGNYDVKINTGR